MTTTTATDQATYNELLNQAYNRRQQELESNKSKLQGYTGYTQIEQAIKTLGIEKTNSIKIGSRYYTTTEVEDLPENDPRYLSYLNLTELKETADNLPDLTDLTKQELEDEGEWTCWLTDEEHDILSDLDL